jgi:hypothetical protein
MYKDKEVKKNVKNIFFSMCDVKVFLTFTSLNITDKASEQTNPGSHFRSGHISD